jgi:H+/Cl- antiporter ClcA
MSGILRQLRLLLGLLAAGAVLGVILGAAGVASVRGWDWTAGTDTSYCGAYLPHWDFYCESAH